MIMFEEDNFLQVWIKISMIMFEEDDFLQVWIPSSDDLIN